MDTEHNHQRERITLAIVDDHYLWREKLDEILAEYGFTVIMKACNGREFLDQLESATAPPDLCLLDISMPVLDGFETARQLKALYPQIRILAFSMDKDDYTINKIMASGAHGFVPKGTHPPVIRDALLQLLNKTSHT